MNTADELRAAAAILRQMRFPAAMTATSSTAALIGARLPLAELLESAAELHEANPPHRGVPRPGCQWCADEDWPCADTRAALAVARALTPPRT
ncbi:hypothetical protein F7R91_14500 [Streptomyces luteolifulvus]|uniref:Uncharacterized protein n=1 Tax=Streptomyces luteolifulvus TaxID=2615112 RepID=A0A6H9V3L8_9ACTN|nr:hypothetical protein [Streptomyces luteolifulvus]KAB1146787.1 hypothetical protein F7R91_14500 [Streptomyces luteolifulvus]